MAVLFYFFFLRAHLCLIVPILTYDSNLVMVSPSSEAGTGSCGSLILRASNCPLLLLLLDSRDSCTGMP
jgi:hypothetical protein